MPNKTTWVTKTISEITHKIYLKVISSIYIAVINAKAKTKEHITEGNTISDKSPAAKESTKINKENTKVVGNFFKFSSTNITSI
ncbi:MAG: hypothetical protein E7211_05455 [Clostridium lundense]|nr:hypothetical protein [Clostridium lundense]